MFHDYNAANQAYDKYMSALKKLEAYGRPGLTALADLLDNPRPIVRIAAAGYLISFFPERAEAVLQAEVLQGGHLAPEALVALQRWKAGIFLDPSTGLEAAKSK